jgi:hypothetical protein
MVARRYRALGGILGWGIPAGAGCVLTVTVVVGDFIDILLVAVLGLVATGLERGQVLEATAHGLSREVRIGGVLLYPARVVAWPAVAEIVTRWRRPNDYTTLETIVSGAGISVRFSTDMGYAAYRALVADIAAHAPAARRTGLTDQLLREPPWPANGTGRTVAFGVALALVILAIWVLTTGR